MSSRSQSSRNASNVARKTGKNPLMAEEKKLGKEAITSAYSETRKERTMLSNRSKACGATSRVIAKHKTACA